MSIRVLIADDEHLARERIRDLLADVQGFDVVGESADGSETVAAVRSLSPDLLFLDVQMPELDGFGVIEQLDPAAMPVILFLTAFDHYAVKAFDVHAIDYLLKPVDPGRFREAIERAREEIERRTERGVAENLRKVLTEHSREEYLERLVVKSGPRIVFLRIAEIDWIEAEENYVRIHSRSEKHLIRHTLSGMEKKLDPRRFARIARSTIVNAERVAEMEHLSKGEYLVVLKDGTRLPLSSMYRDRLEACLGAF